MIRYSKDKGFKETMRTRAFIKAFERDPQKAEIFLLGYDPYDLCALDKCGFIPVPESDSPVNAVRDLPGHAQKAATSAKTAAANSFSPSSGLPIRPPPLVAAAAGAAVTLSP